MRGAFVCRIVCSALLLPTAQQEVVVGVVGSLPKRNAKQDTLLRSSLTNTQVVKREQWVGKTPITLTNQVSWGIIRLSSNRGNSGFSSQL